MGAGSVGSEATGADVGAVVESDWLWLKGLIDEPLQAVLTNVKTPDKISKIAFGETGFGIRRRTTARKNYRLQVKFSLFHFKPTNGGQDSVQGDR